MARKGLNGLTPLPKDCEFFYPRTLSGSKQVQGWGKELVRVGLSLWGALTRPCQDPRPVGRRKSCEGPARQEITTCVIAALHAICMRPARWVTWAPASEWHSLFLFTLLPRQ